MGLLDKKDFPGTYDSPFVKFTSDFYPRTFFEQGQAVGTIADQLDYLPKLQMETWGKSARSAAAQIGITVGIPDQWLKGTKDNPLGALGGLLDIDYTEFQNFNIDSAMQIVEKGVYMAFSTALSSVASAVPMVGGIAQFALFIVQVARAGIASASTDPDRNDQQFTAMAYNKDHDEITVRNMLTFLHGEHDLTNLFMPARIPRDRRDIVAGAGFTDRGPYGVVVSVRGEKVGSVEAPAFAGVPAMTDLADAVQYSQATGGAVVKTSMGAPESVKDEDVLVGRGTPQTYGEQNPASSQFSATLWQAVLKNSPMAFRIDGWKIADAWEQYYKVLIDWAVNEPAGDNAKRHRWAMLSQVLCWAQKGTAGRTRSLFDPYFPEPGGAGAGPYPGNDCPSDLKCVPKEYVQWRGQQASNLWADRGPLIRYLIEQQWANRLERYLGTLTVAYVPPGAAALRNPRLRQAHQVNREKLLVDDAKYLVDQSMIPDEAYKARMRTATLSPTGQIRAALTPAQEKRFADLAIESIPIIDMSFVKGGKVVPLANPTGDMLAIQHVDLPEIEGMSAGGVALLAAGLGAGAAGVWAVSRALRNRGSRSRRRRRR